jgi:hypothetical protein
MSVIPFHLPTEIKSRIYQQRLKFPTPSLPEKKKKGGEEKPEENAHGDPSTSTIFKNWSDWKGIDPVFLSTFFSSPLNSGLPSSSSPKMQPVAQTSRFLHYFFFFLEKRRD